MSPLLSVKTNTKELKQRLKYTTRTPTDKIIKQKIYRLFQLKNTTKYTVKRKKQTMNNFKTSPNQKTITVEKEKCDKQHLYTTINLLALETAGAELKAGAFKLWVYIAKNQNNFTFGLSNKAVAECFGIKKD